MDEERKTLSLPHCTDYPRSIEKFFSTLDGFLFCSETELSQNHQGQDCRPNGAYSPPARHWFSLGLWPELSNHPVSRIMWEWSLIRLRSQHLCKQGHPPLESPMGKEPGIRRKFFRITILASEATHAQFLCSFWQCAGCLINFNFCLGFERCFAMCAVRKPQCHWTKNSETGFNSKLLIIKMSFKCLLIHSESH